jgi:hypothetical protein
VCLWVDSRDRSGSFGDLPRKLTVRKDLSLAEQRTVAVLIIIIIIIIIITNEKQSMRNNTKLHGVAPPKTVTFSVTTVKTSHFM